jgi:hypothetical protein
MPDLHSVRTDSSSAKPAIGLSPSLLLLSLISVPALLGLLTLQELLKWLESVGIASEEIFRGNRLPVLHFPCTNRD